MDEYMAVLPDDQNDLQSNVTLGVNTEHEHIYLVALAGDEELQPSNAQCTIAADSVEAEYLAVLLGDEGDLHSNVAHRSHTDADEYLVLQKRPQDELQTYSTCNNATQPTAAANSHSKLDRSTDTNSLHIDVNTCSPTYDSHTIVNAGLPTYGLSETRQQADASVLHMMNTEHHYDADTNYSQIEDSSCDFDDTYTYTEELSITNNTIFKYLSFIAK
jgi:hypothetical protein